MMSSRFKYSVGEKSQRGFAIVSAMFLIVVLGALVGFIVSISTNQQIGSALDIQGVRAYEAARSGAEWGMYRQMQAGSCAANSSYVPVAPTLSTFTVTVTCTTAVDSNGGPTSYVVTAIACSQPSGGACPNTTNPGSSYIERRVDVSF